MKVVLTSITLLMAVTALSGCKRDDGKKETAKPVGPIPAKEPPPAADGRAAEHAEGEGHAHDEVPLGKVIIGELEVELAQGHGKVEAGKESHLVVKLPYDDQGSTVVRAWIGTEDRTSSVVGKGDYAASHHDYDIHAMAPDPLPENVMWWIEIEKPDGTKSIGSVEPFK